MAERAVLTFLGALLALVGVLKILWNIYAWGKLSEHGHRPFIYPEGSPRVSFWVEVIMAAIGITLVAIAWVI